MDSDAAGYEAAVVAMAGIGREVSGGMDGTATERPEVDAHTNETPKLTLTPPDDPTRTRMRRQNRRDTQPEVALRRSLHARGLRYRVDAPLPLPQVRRRADLLFSGAKVAVFVDGCFWHSCPTHRTSPRTNVAFWTAKLATNTARDRDTDDRLADAGWLSVRVWEHEQPEDAANRVERAVRERSSLAATRR